VRVVKYACFLDKNRYAVHGKIEMSIM
jgi:hypothetical protein